VLETVSRLAAPLLPLVTENIWQGLTGGRSVHLEDWPDATEFPADHELVAAMDAVRQIASTGQSLRKANGLRVRLPLAQLTVVVPQAGRLAGFEPILRDELNVKTVTLIEETETSADDHGITRRLSVNARAAGPRLGKQVQEAIKAARTGDWSETDGVVTAGGIALEPGEYELVLEVAQKPGDASEALALLPGGGFVLLDTHVTPELEAEGTARDLIRSVQDARKAAGLEVSDRIRLRLVLDQASVAAARTHAELIAAETLAVDFAVDEGAQSIEVERVEA
jgi:isoleucyl-tRNA synthetase